MRLAVSGIAIIVLFALGVWAISLLLPNGAAWLGIGLAMSWLFGLCYWAVLRENKRLRKGNDQRLLLVSGVLAGLSTLGFIGSTFKYDVGVPKWAAEIAILAIVGAVFFLFHRVPVHRTPDEVIGFLEQALHSGVDSSWENFVGTRIAEPDLDAVRVKLLRLDTDSKEEFDQKLESLIEEVRGSRAEVAR